MPDIVSPIDGKVAFEFDYLRAEQAIARVGRAQQVQSQWAKVPLPGRVGVCLRLLDAYRSELESNAEQITKMMGKPISQARGEFEGGTVERTRYLCDIAADALADVELHDRPGFRRRIARVPVGVVLDIAAWNFPLLIAINVIVPSVLAGNAVLVKHARQTALVADQFERAFEKAGAPAGLVQAFHVTHEVNEQVLSSRRIGYVSFTGSVRGGHEVARAVARDNFIGTGFELGGKDGALVLPDADLQSTVDGLVDGAYYNAGQSCCGIERIYVHEDLYESFVEAYVAKVREYRLGDPLQPDTTLGPVARSSDAQQIRSQVERALSAGAKTLVPADAFDVPELSDCYLAPQVLVDVDHSMDVMTEETFGPVVGIMKVPSVEEGIRLMNDSKYGLTGSIWTSDVAQAESLAPRIEAGTVFMNRCDYLDPGLAWTGVKDSGNGCSLSKLGFLSVTRPKSFHFKTQA